MKYTLPFFFFFRQKKRCVNIIKWVYFYMVHLCIECEDKVMKIL